MKRLNDSKVIGLEQRVPLEFLNQGMITLLETGEVSKEELLNLMLTVTKGKNRAERAASYAARIIRADNMVIKKIKEHFTTEPYARYPEKDKKLIMLCLASVVYPIMYDALCIIGTQLKIQKTITRAFITRKLSRKYGSNRTFEVAVDALVPMIVETGLIERVKLGVYSLPSEKQLLQPFTHAIWILTDNLIAGTGELPAEEQDHRPWMVFV